MADVPQYPIELLEPYGRAVQAYQEAKADYDEAAKTIAPAKEAMDVARQSVQDVVDKGMLDVFKVLKGTRGGGGPRAPRDPSKKAAVLDAISNGPRLLKDIVKETGLERTYITSTLNAAIKKGSVTSVGERAERTFEFTGEVAEEA